MQSAAATAKALFAKGLAGAGLQQPIAAAAQRRSAEQQQDSAPGRTGTAPKRLDPLRQSATAFLEQGWETSHQQGRQPGRPSQEEPSRAPAAPLARSAHCSSPGLEDPTSSVLCTPAPEHAASVAASLHAFSPPHQAFQAPRMQPVPAAAASDGHAHPQKALLPAPGLAAGGMGSHLSFPGPGEVSTPCHRLCGCHPDIGSALQFQLHLLVLLCPQVHHCGGV